MGFESMPSSPAKEQEETPEQKAEIEKKKNKLEYLQRAMGEAEKTMENEKNRQEKAEGDAEQLKQEMHKMHEASGWKEMDDDREYQKKDKLRQDLIKDARREADNWMKTASEQSKLQTEKKQLEAELKS